MAHVKGCRKCWKGHPFGVILFLDYTSEECSDSLHAISRLTPLGSGGHFIIKISPYQCRDYYYKDKTVWRPSHLHDKNPMPGKTDFILRHGPRSSYFYGLGSKWAVLHLASRLSKYGACDSELGHHSFREQFVRPQVITRKFADYGLDLKERTQFGRIIIQI